MMILPACFSKEFFRRDFLKGLFAASALSTSGSFDAFGASKDDASNMPRSSEGTPSPYGVCAHIGAGEEWEQSPKNLELMRAAGIRWVRADFSWIGVERKENEWNFDRLDKVVEDARRLDMTILPILDYSVPWATPSFRHLDKWLEYVRRTVSRYCDRIKCWEVWNEENLKQFWAEDPNPEDYANLLRETYRVIKEIDPNLVVVYGGLAGVPADFFAKTLDAGVADFFDVVNIHPYRGGLTTPERVERFQKEIEAFQEELQKRNVAKRPIWITEMGWATPPSLAETNRRVVAAALQRLFPGQTPRVAFFYDQRYEPAAARSQEDLLSLLPENYRSKKNLVSFLDADEMRTATPESYPVLIMPPGETFPADCFDSMVEYVKRGGTLTLLGGVPLYYASRLDAKTNKYVRTDGNPTLSQNMKSLRISWFAWWTRENVPETAPIVVAPNVDTDAFEGYQPSSYAGRFLCADALAEGDKMFSLLNGEKDAFSASTACVYKFNSDYKGAVIVSTVMESDGLDSNVTTVSNQGVFLPQAILLAFAFGVERYFWYEFQAPERDRVDPEHHFGIVGQKLDPKPGYHAYKTLTRARPAGSIGDSARWDGDLISQSWTRPDGKTCWAVWSMRASLKRKIEVDGEIEEAFDYLGNTVKIPENGETLSLSPQIVYLVGNKGLVVKVS